MKENIHGSFGVRVKKDWKRNRSLYIMFIPVVLFYVLFMYKPMYGVIISFMDYAQQKEFGEVNGLALNILSDSSQARILAVC